MNISQLLKQKPPISKTVIRSYSLLFLVLAIWSIIPIFIPYQYGLVAFKNTNLFVNILFSFLCLIACFGTLFQHYYLGRYLGLSLLTLVILYQGSRLYIEPNLNPLLIFSYLNFIIILLAYSKITPTAISIKDTKGKLNINEAIS